MKVCTKCGRDVQDVDRFCPKCGNTRFTDKSVRPAMRNCSVCGGSTDYLWTCAKCGKQVCRNCTKTSGYLDIICAECSQKESEPPKQEAKPEEPKIEVIEAPKTEGFFSKIIAWFKNLFSRKEPAEEVKTSMLPPPGAHADSPTDNLGPSAEGDSQQETGSSVKP